MTGSKISVPSVRGRGPGRKTIKVVLSADTFCRAGRGALHLHGSVYFDIDNVSNGSLVCVRARISGFFFPSSFSETRRSVGQSTQRVDLGGGAHRGSDRSVASDIIEDAENENAANTTFHTYFTRAVRVNVLYIICIRIMPK